ncbi:MAG: hypothetical protein O4965_20060 [Trichodesmium sp. St19_bin1]|nr:hypothetical protein [Trichodesmium sp. St19_bin1]
MDLKVPSPLVEGGIEQQACLGLYRFHEAVVAYNVCTKNSHPSWPKGTGKQPSRSSDAG